MKATDLPRRALSATEMIRELPEALILVARAGSGTVCSAALLRAAGDIWQRPAQPCAPLGLLNLINGAVGSF